VIRNHADNGKPSLVVSPEAESSIAIMFEHSTCCYESAVKELYAAVSKILKHWTDGVLGNGSNAYEIRVKVPKQPKKLIRWRHPSPGSPNTDPYSDHDTTPIFLESNPEGDFDYREVLNLKTNQILSLEPVKFESFRRWLASSDVKGARELLEVLNVQQELEQQRAELQRKIYSARRGRASMFGYIGTMLFDLMNGESVPSKQRDLMNGDSVEFVP